MVVTTQEYIEIYYKHSTAVSYKDTITIISHTHTHTNLTAFQEAFFEAVDGCQRKLRVDLRHFDVPTRVVLPDFVGEQQAAQQDRAPGFRQQRHVALLHQSLHVNEAHDAAFGTQPGLVEQGGNEMVYVGSIRRRVRLVHL